ncbi:MAG TPA: FHA domain-containing protein [Streptosporangiaceae bacterium]|nr:FHA domain-containing protein [Streptosporangiaceae bacterium]
MTGGGEPAGRPARAPLRQRSRRRWAAAGGVAAGWVVLEVMTGSAVSATVVLVVIAGLGVAGLSGLRALGITRDHPWMQRIASRPWRDGQDVLKVAMRHLPDVFVVTPSGSLLAPVLVELQLNPHDLAALCEQMELGVISSSLTEVYQEQVAGYRARLARPGQPEVYVTASGSVPPGRYRLRQGDPVRAGTRPDPAESREFAYAASEHAYAGPVSSVWQDPGPVAAGDPGPTVAAGLTTIMAASLPAVPALRLVTGSSTTETRMSGARAGRGPVELILPDVPTVSREHARFTFSDGRWWISNQGRNGLILNGAPVAGEQPLSDGDSIRWGTNRDAPLSRVEIS